MDLIRVALVEDDVSVRAALGELLNSADGFRCVVAEGSFEAAHPRMLAEAPDVALLDIGLPGMAGSEGVRILRETIPGMQVLMLTVHAEQDRIFTSICNGACGYLLKKTPAAKLLEAIREVKEGGAPMSPEIARQVIGVMQRGAEGKAAEDEGLSGQEVRVLQLLAGGRRYQAAAKELGITVNTLRNYVRRIYQKLHVHTKSEAVSKALRAGIIR